MRLLNTQQVRNNNEMSPERATRFLPAKIGYSGYCILPAFPVEQKGHQFHEEEKWRPESHLGQLTATQTSCHSNPVSADGM